MREPSSLTAQTSVGPPATFSSELLKGLILTVTVTFSVFEVEGDADEEGVDAESWYWAALATDVARIEWSWVARGGSTGFGEETEILRMPLAAICPGGASEDAVEEEGLGICCWRLGERDAQVATEEEDEGEENIEVRPEGFGEVAREDEGERERDEDEEEWGMPSLSATDLSMEEWIEVGGRKEGRREERRGEDRGRE